MSAASSGNGHRGVVLLLRWSWRDLRARWIQVLALALVIALGIGSYAGLTSVTRWRRLSTDEAYQQLRLYDVRVKLAEGSTVTSGELTGIAATIDGAAGIAAMEERLISEIQVDASVEGQTILVPGLLYGIGVEEAGPRVDDFYAAEGRTLNESDAGTTNVILERNFAKHYELAATGNLRIGSSGSFTYVGQVLTPEYFLVTTEQGGLLAEANFAAVFTSLETAQRVSGQPGQVNDLLISLDSGSDPETAKQAIQAVFAAQPGIDAIVLGRDDDPSYRLNDRDIEGDQEVFQILAVLVFGGAVAAAFNLSARIVEAQRREIGIAMALGLPPWRIALRPLLVGAQVSLLGVVLGLGTGYVIGQSLISLARELQPLPEWKTPFQADLFLTVAAIGFVLPLFATAWPVWRAVWVPPIETIRPAYRAGKGGGLAPLVSRLRLPGNTLQQGPLRNIVRSPRRSLLTGLGIAAALAALVSFVGMIDSFITTTDRGDRELLGETPGRIEVRLAGFLPVGGRDVTAIVSAPLIERAEPGLLLNARTASPGAEELDLQVELLDLEGEIWRPSLVEGSYDSVRPGIYLSELAAKDLGLGIGSTVTLEHPLLDPSGALVPARSELTLLGIHPNPFRFAAYMDISQAGVFGLEGLANRVKVLPEQGVSRDDLKRELIGYSGVASMESVGDIAQAVRDLLDEFVVVLRVVEGAVLLIALLIAFNSAAINMDERSREHATMFAFGLPVGTVLRLAVLESLFLGIAATIVGLASGWLLLGLIIDTRVAETLPDIYIKASVGATTLLITCVVGTLCVALAPLLTWRRLARMDVPGALKVVE